MDGWGFWRPRIELVKFKRFRHVLKAAIEPASSLPILTHQKPQRARSGRPGLQDLMPKLSTTYSMHALIRSAKHNQDYYNIVINGR